MDRLRLLNDRIRVLRFGRGIGSCCWWRRPRSRGVPASRDWEGNGDDGTRTLFYVANIGRTDLGNASLIAHTWSLSIEEQFYLVWPLVLLLLWHEP